MKKHQLLWVLLAGLALGYGLGGLRSSHDGSDAVAGAGDAETTYTCSMHPQIRQPGPGLCPLCAMDLIPVGDDAADAGPRALKMSDAARELARIETAPVVRGEARADLRVAGTLAYDLARVREVVLLADGQLRVLHANVPGMAVAAGDPLAEVYSPEVYAASRELAVAGSPPVAEAARRKLLLLGMEEAEIDRIRSSGGDVPETFTVRSPVNGVVTDLAIREGAWAMRGARLLELADTSVIWGLFDVYERDLQHVRRGEGALVDVEALAGTTWTGTVSFLPADLDPGTRSLRARVDLPNPEGALKPGMLARARMDVKVADDVLLVPATAVLQTGKRAVVYVQSPEDPSIFEGRVVRVGPRAGDQVVILDGLETGELVVSRGAMRIDGSLQILAKPSMMSLTSEGAAMRPQIHCPIAGGRIDPKDFVDYQGYRIYFCCPGCDDEFLRDPERYLEEMRAQGIEPERAPVEGGGHDHAH
ncbi:MAG TPA: efflux RND transporter periplasmic adaptor subunit [Kiritimatiellia bacterium]|nr:efflux RND transporter periplasmic adaptor subunit [Kiritimatiellia bacterium]